ncbi:MOSC domain-containing protein [Paucibacter sp. KBW04]|uniref:MOSC domain-containing protein n=1 Tax=Paucibacter sp. KBW04 TaxID=2153361 RepID=UPI000F581663|nr:MOSC domain-containing protein [Paucibacter sp. KBW04]RQO60491.1 MOSC domain-containing protein [Paucibacter sp. KBW04]
MNSPTLLGHVRSVLIGRAVPSSRPGVLSAIAKQPVEGRIAVHPLGLLGDEQGDLRVHGGPDKAVHCYSWSHYQAWREALPDCALLQAPGAFGENLSVDGVDEESICLGDQLRIGTARFSLSQGRQPCWKLNDRFGQKDMAKQVQTSLRAGWYLRVERPGEIGAGDAIELLARPYPQASVARLLRAIRDREQDPAQLRELLALPLTESWRRLFAGRLDSGQIEAWAPRMGEE